MPKSAVPRGAGNYNLKGKKTHLCSCKCCNVVDFRDSYETARVANEDMLERPEDYKDVTAFEASLPDVSERKVNGPDKGEWTISIWDGKVALFSSDFTHDVALYITGDFGSEREKVLYANDLALRLNRTVPKPYEYGDDY